MPETVAPGVYVEDAPAGAHVIAGVPTSTAAFVGATRAGPVAAPLIVHSFADPTTVEARLDRRHGQQRRRSAARAAGDERRERDRRSRDIRHQLQSIGWALVPAAERSA